MIRPVYDGLMEFAAIRDASAPEEYSWKVNLREEQILRPVNSRFVEIAYEDGPEAALISAQHAHDALGTEVPTTLSVSEGDVITLTVPHREGSYVYPVVAGAGFEGAFITNPGPGLKSEQELWEEQEPWIREEEERRALEEEGLLWSQQLPEGYWLFAEGGQGIAGPPEYDRQESSEATASGVVTGPIVISMPFKGPACWHFRYGDSPVLPYNPHERAGECNLTDYVMTRGWVHGHFHYELEPGKGVWWDNGREGEINCNVDYLHNKEWAMFPKECHFSGQNLQKGAHSHIVARDFWRIETHNGLLNGGGYEVICEPMHIDLFANGNVGKNIVEDQGNSIRHENFGDACPWPN